jgi:hypothetical protein
MGTIQPFNLSFKHPMISLRKLSFTKLFKYPINHLQEKSMKSFNSQEKILKWPILTVKRYKGKLITLKKQGIMFTKMENLKQ